MLEALVPAVLEQKVLGKEARRAWRQLLHWHGLPAPGPAPAGMRVFPPAATWRSIPSFDWHRAGVEAVRARTIAGAAFVAGRLEAAAATPGADFDRMLRSLPGIGPWTSAEVRQRACGDADAVSVGDYHLPTVVGWTLAGEPADDERMLELLAPLCRASLPGHPAHRARRQRAAAPRPAAGCPRLPVLLRAVASRRIARRRGPAPKPGGNGEARGQSPGYGSSRAQRARLPGRA